MHETEKFQLPTQPRRIKAQLRLGALGVSVIQPI